MGVQAAWNGYTWGYSSKKARPLEDLSTGRSVSVEQSKSKKGKTTQKSTYDLVTVTAKFTLTASCGCNPLSEFYKLRKMVGRYAPLFIGGKKFMKCRNFMLEQIAVSSKTLDGAGRILSLDATVTWKEYRRTKKGLMAQSGAKAKLKPGVKKYNARKSALAIGATSADKNKRKAKNKQMTKWKKK